jgi:DNA-binding winged helix-turn-helix (wHTH) protein
MLYMFGECTLDTQRYELCRAGHVNRLRHKVFQVLVYLLTHADRVVSKQELREQVWPQQLISDAALESTIKAVRQVIGDSGRGQQLIQTLYGQGYRFVAAVQAHPDQGTAGTRRRDGAAPQRGTSGSSPDRTAASADSEPETDARVEEASLQRSASAAAGERKLVTALCCALAESPTGSPLEVEPYYSALRALHALVREAVQRYGGTLQPLVSEQITAIFGAPLAQEDHARCAVLAALDLEQRLRQHPPLYPAARGVGLAVRLGLHSGLVVVGEIGPAAHGQVTAVGAPIQGALQLQQQATSGTILVSAATYHLVQEEVRGEPCGSLALDGQQEPLPVYAVQGLVQRRAGVPQRAPWARSPFVGRQRELGLLHDRLEAVRGGAGQVVSLVGPPGVGKTWLLTEFRRRLSPHQVTWYLGQCLAYGQATPYLPVRDIVQQVCAITPGDALETRIAAVRRRLAALGDVAEADMALLLQLLDLPGTPETLEQHTPEARQARTFALLGHLIGQAAQRQPLALAVENVHWIDPTSEAWLGSLIERLGGMAVLLLMTARPGYQAPWAAHAAATRLALPPLRVQESQTLVEAVPGAARLPVAQRQQIVAQGAGNPFFVEELTWHAVEHGLAVTPVPETVHAVLAARLDQMPAAAKDLLQTAAVIGHEVPVPLLQTMAELPDDALQWCLAHLQSAELLYETRLIPTRVYTFKHALTHEVAYGSLLHEQRCALHARIVEALEAGPREQVGLQVAHLAHHALRGEVWDKAVVYCRQAGVQALARSAYREAVTSFEQALEALQHLPKSHATRAQAIDIRLDLRNALWTLGDLDRLSVNLQEAEGLAKTLGDPHRLGWASVYLLAHFAQVCDPDCALTSGQRALAGVSGDRGLQGVESLLPQGF